MIMPFVCRTCYFLINYIITPSFSLFSLALGITPPYSEEHLNQSDTSLLEKTCFWVGYLYTFFPSSLKFKLQHLAYFSAPSTLTSQRKLQAHRLAWRKNSVFHDWMDGWMSKVISCCGYSVSVFISGLYCFTLICRSKSLLLDFFLLCPWIIYFPIALFFLVLFSYLLLS